MPHYISQPLDMGLIAIHNHFGPKDLSISYKILISAPPGPHYTFGRIVYKKTRAQPYKRSSRSVYLQL
ncbi:hypothetical protein DSUL_30057 [Desulfovibrionales bacterium]